MTFRWLDVNADTGPECQHLCFAAHFADAIEYDEDFVHVAVCMWRETSTGRDAGLGNLGEMRDRAVADKNLFSYARIVTKRFAVQTVQVDAAHSDSILSVGGIVKAVEQVRAEGVLRGLLQRLVVGVGDVKRVLGT